MVALLHSRPRAWTGVYFGVGLAALATLIVELALTRIFSVIFYYHFAFLAISIALFGLGAGGVLSYALGRWRAALFSKLGWLSALNALLVLAAVAFLLSIRGEPGYGTLAMVYFASALPFIGSGTILSLAIAETIERVNRVYFADLAGAAAGCAVLVPLLNRLGGPNAVLAAGALFAASSVVWFLVSGDRRKGYAAAALTAALAALVAVNANTRVIDVRYAKGQELTSERFVRWNSFSRVALGKDPYGKPNIVIDADAATGIPAYDFARLTDEQRCELLSMGPGLPYVLRPGAKALIIGAGGGWDVARALASGSRDVTGVEINPIIANTIMRGEFSNLSNGLFHRPEVRIVVEDGRGFVRGSRERYDVIQATLVDTWAATAAGAFALSENNLYTVEAFREYLSHLTPNGILVFTRWGLEPPRESLRLLSLAREALAGLGEPEAWKHVIVVREGTETQLAAWGNADTVIISRSPLAAEDLERLKSAVDQGRMRLLYAPGAGIRNAFTEFLESRDPQRFAREYHYDISPVWDNRPFFFYTVQPRDIWNFLTKASRLSADYNINRAVPLLFGLLLISIVATAVMLVLPRLVLGSRLPQDRRTLRFLWYFILIGTGYVLIQVALVQKFVLFLGHPTYALTGIIFSMLISSGVGSYASQRIVNDCHARLQAVLAGVAVLIAALAFAVAALLSAGIGLPMWSKLAASVLIIAPAGFLMGIPFPTGLRRLEKEHKPSVRWAWSLNAAASVLGSVLAVVLAIYLGLRETLLAGGLMYLLALWPVRLSAPREAPVEAEPPQVRAAL
ncbi:MAG: hypothetical protein ACM3ZB_17355 [bacterium]